VEILSVTSPNIIILTGPTASGKSALALAIAQHLPCVILNADSQQVYRELPILSAQPSKAEQQQTPHRLYSYLSANDICTAARWLGDVIPEIHNAWNANILPILVGGTGMYIKSLMQGLAEIPAVAPEILQQLILRAQNEGPEILHRELEKFDPEIAAKLKLRDQQRIIRALSVFLSTQKPLSYWQKKPVLKPLPQANWQLFALCPERQLLYQQAETRFDKMLEDGAIEEVKSLAQLNLNPEKPILKSHGVPEISAYLAGHLSLDAMKEQAIRNVRHYIKRQLTWIRQQWSQDSVSTSAESIIEKIIKNQNKLLT
jgi:tRNA dimethylallyltransferase